MKRQVFLALLLVVLVLASACTPKPAPTPTPTPAPLPPVAAPPTPTATPAPWGDWDKVLMAARNEGKVVVYSTGLLVGARTALTPVLKEKFGIYLDLVVGLTPAIQEKVASEHRAKAYACDVYEGGAMTPTVVFEKAGYLGEPIKVPSALEPVWMTDTFRSDPGGRVFSYVDRGTSPIVINTRLVPPDQEPKSWMDLLDPKWKGKILIDDPSNPGPGMAGYYYIAKYLINVDYWKKMAEQQQPKLSRNWSEQVDMLIKGDYPILLFAQGGFLVRALDAGAPLKVLRLKEGSLATSAISLAYITNAPHPNASKVFINYYLSQEGQLLWSKILKQPSLRKDVPQDHVSPDIRILPGDKWTSFAKEDYVAFSASMQQAAEVFGLKK